MSNETTGVTGPAGPAGATESTHRGRRGLIVLGVLALIVGAASSWAYNAGLPTRQDRDDAVIRASTNPSTYVTPGDYNNLTVPIRNDSPYAVTIVGLSLPTAPRIEWNGAWTVVQPGETVSLEVNAPFGCAAIPHTIMHPAAVLVLLRVQTVDGATHYSMRTFIGGALQYAADYCAISLPPAKDDNTA
ncbi:MAG TPA: hypothetical protein VGS97_08430 [Actinocrinis sp.]|nr:hypothetical protein [Actinocrinis sp.]